MSNLTKDELFKVWSKLATLAELADLKAKERASALDRDGALSWKYAKDTTLDIAERVAQEWVRAGTAQGDE